jgi:predicted permease
VSPSLLLELVAVFAVIGVGWVAGKARVLGPQAAGALGAAAFGLFTPALLFRTTAHIPLARLPWATIAAYYVPTVSVLLVVYAWRRVRSPAEPVAPTVRALELSFSNTVQLGVPVVTALFGAAGLGIHIALASLQSLVLLTTSTVLVEIDLARSRNAGATVDREAAADVTRRPASRREVVLATAAATARRALVHPVVLPVLLGLAYNATGLPVPGPVDDVLRTLGQAVVPVSLVTIGLTLAQHGIAGTAFHALGVSLGKLLVQPALVLALAYWGLGLRGLPLTIAVLCAALPIGSNVLLFAQRYETLEAEVTSAIVTSTVTFLVTGTLWLLLLAHLQR